MPHVGTLDVDLSLDPRLWVTENTPPGRSPDGARLQSARRVPPVPIGAAVPAQDGGRPIDIVVDFLMPRDAEIVKNSPPLVADFAVQKADGADWPCGSISLSPYAATMPNGGHNRVELAVCSIPALLAMKGHALEWAAETEGCL